MSSTHAGGIQPSASFFRPSRPTYQYSRPSSPSSTVQQPNPDAAFPLSHISYDDHHSLAGHTDSIDDALISIKRVKQSREPLLPLGTRITLPASTTPDPLARSALNSPSHTTSKSASRLVRNSFDRVLSISRGLSFDSIRKSSSSRPPLPFTSEQGAATAHFDSKISDEEHGYPSKGSLTLQQQQPHSVRLSRTSALPSTAPSPAPSSSFNPAPPNRHPPLSAVPVVDQRTGRVRRRYEVHPSRNRFFLGGRLLSGGDSPWAFMAAFGLVLGVSGVWFSTTAVWWWKNESPVVAAVGAYMALLTIVTMLATATLDPGILPRGLDPDPPYPATSPSDGGVRAPMPRDLKVRSDVVRVKYCPTCKTYRPPRSSHCKMCDNCVDGCDHHCQWVNNCIGRRNYTTFFVLLVSVTLTLILIICTSALHIVFLTRRENVGLKGALHRGAGSAVAFCLSIAVIWPVAALLTYHMRLLLLNITTIEQIRNQAHKTLMPGPPPPNPFSHGNWRRNLIAVLCRPQGFSWLDAHGVVTEDKREVNPGMLGEG